jgi:hypothetical protein
MMNRRPPERPPARATHASPSEITTAAPSSTTRTSDASAEASQVSTRDARISASENRWKMSPHKPVSSAAAPRPSGTYERTRHCSGVAGTAVGLSELTFFSATLWSGHRGCGSTARTEGSGASAGTCRLQPLDGSARSAGQKADRNPQPDGAARHLIYSPLALFPLRHLLSPPITFVRFASAPSDGH